MPPSPPTTVYPRCSQLLQVGKESGGFAVTPSQTAFVSVPVADFLPDPKVTWVEDNSMWGDFVRTHDLQQGPIWAESEIKESPLYGDTFPHFLYNLMGDLTTTGTAATPTWTTSGALSPGAGPIAVASGSVASAGTFVQIDSTVNSEVVKVGAGSTATSIVVDTSTPIRLSHLSGVSVTTVTAPFSHTISLLNPGSSTGVTTGQGPTHTFIHRTNIPGAGNNYAWQFAYGVMSKISIMGKASGALTWSGTVTHLKRAYPSFIPVASFSSVRLIPAWRSTTSLASSTVNDVTDWQLDLTRQVEVTPTGDGVQDPFGIFRGNLDAQFKLTFDPALDESPLNYVMANTQPTFAETISNGLSGASLVSMTVNAQLAGFKDSPLKADKTMWGWAAAGELIGNTTNAGNSGGRSPLSVVFQNAIPTY